MLSTSAPSDPAPPIEGKLYDGVTGHPHKVQVEVRDLSLDELLASREIFVCNSIVGVWPVRRIGSRDYTVGPMTRLAAQWAAEP